MAFSLELSECIGGDGRYKPGPTPAAKVDACLALSRRVIRKNLCHGRRIFPHDLHEHYVLLVLNAVSTTQTE